MGKKKSKASRNENSRQRSEIFTKKYVPFQKNFLLLILPLLITATYFHTLHSPFVFDDIANVSANPAAQVSDLSFQSLKKTAIGSPIATRPVSYLTFAINYYFHGNEVYGYRLFNMAIHILNGLLLYLFLINTFNLPVLQGKIKQPFWVAYLAALIWIIHPLQVQSVTYIVQRMNSLATLFYMLAFYCYLKARLDNDGTRRLVLAGLSFISGLLALGSKEIAVTLPFFILLYEWMFFRDMEFRWLKRHWIAIIGVISFLLGLLIGMIFIYVGKNPWQTISAGYGGRDFTMWERLLTEPRVILHYISLFLYPDPDRLTLLPQFQVSTSLLKPPTTLFALLASWIIVIFAIVIAQKQRLISFCILWFMGNLVVESSVVSLEIIFQHRTYLPSMLASLLVVYLILQYIKPVIVSKAILVTALSVLTFWTYERNQTWCDKVDFWQDCLQKNPSDFRVYNNLGKAMEEKGKIHEAIYHYKKAVETNPDHPRPYNNLGVALLNTGKENEAVDVLHNGLENNPSNPETHYNLGLTHGTLGELDDAEEHYLEAHEHFPRDSDPDVHNNLAITLARQGKLEEAIEHFREAIRIHYDDPFAHNNLGITLARAGKYEESIIHFQHALRINPNDRFAWNNLQIVIAELKKP